MSEVKYQCNMKPTDTGCTVGDVKRCLKAFGFQDVKHDFAHFGGSCDDMTHIDNNITYMIKNNKPVIMLSGAMNNVDGIFGHVFVLDGYKKDSTGEYVHINWGWWGASDGYYAKGCFDLNERAGCESGIDAGNEATEKDNYHFFHYYVYYVM